MDVSITDIFKIGMGPSSSHTMGPLKAAREFIKELGELGNLNQITKIDIELFGSLAHTGKGHGTDKAIIWGLMGQKAAEIDLDWANEQFEQLEKNNMLQVTESLSIPFKLGTNIIFNKTKVDLPHPNTLILSAYHKNTLLLEQMYFSIGGGKIVQSNQAVLSRKSFNPPYPFNSAQDLLNHCSRENKAIHEIVWENEKSFRDINKTKEHIKKVWSTMESCIKRGCHSKGLLPGPLRVPKRAPLIYKKLKSQKSSDPLILLDWVNLYALAVNEENASGGVIVTAPTNGAAGIIPAVLKYGLASLGAEKCEDIENFLITASAIASLYQKNASLSGAEVGCQGEVGVACSMAAAGLTAILGGSPAQVENAAEIAMEHNLGLTCDPVGGLVQIPCIERNAMGSIKAINASRLALQGNGDHYISLDKVIKTMKQTGLDMQDKYKETSRGGLAVNIIEC